MIEISLLSLGISIGWIIGAATVVRKEIKNPEGVFKEGYVEGYQHGYQRGYQD